MSDRIAETVAVSRMISTMSDQLSPPVNPTTIREVLDSYGPDYVTGYAVRALDDEAGIGWGTEVVAIDKDDLQSLIDGKVLEVPIDGGVHYMIIKLA